MPHRIEIAKSGRSRCRACKRTIDKGQRRFAESVPNPVADGDTSHFYHLICAAERRPGPFGELLSSEARAEAIEGVEELATLEASVAAAQAHRRLERLGVIERAKSARAKCRHCRQAIEKDALRIALQPIEDGMMQNWGFLHLGCVASYAGLKPDARRLTRYADLSEADASEAIALVRDSGDVPEGEP